MKKLFSSLKSSHGFTLIELLIVIAIIGILSVVVFTQLGSARDKSRVAKLKSEMASLRSQAEVFYNNYNYSYGTPGECDSGSTAMPMGDLFAFPADQYGMATILDSVRTGVVVDRATLAPRIWCESGGNDEWAVIGHISGVNPPPLPGKPPSSIPEIYWCVDSKGASREITDRNALSKLEVSSPSSSGFISSLNGGIIECPQ